MLFINECIIWKLNQEGHKHKGLSDLVVEFVHQIFCHNGIGSNTKPESCKIKEETWRPSTTQSWMEVDETPGTLPELGIAGTWHRQGKYNFKPKKGRVRFDLTEENAAVKAHLEASQFQQHLLQCSCREKGI